MLADLAVHAGLSACGSCRGMDPIQEHHTSFKDLWSPSKPEGVVQLSLPGRAGVTGGTGGEMCWCPFSSWLTLQSQRSRGSREGAVEVTSMSFLMFCANHPCSGCFWSWKAFPCCLWFQDPRDDSGRKNILASAAKKEKEMKGLSVLGLSWEDWGRPCFGSSCGITSTLCRTCWSQLVCG